MRRSLLDRPDECVAAIALLDRGADALLAEDIKSAENLITAADIGSLTQWYVESQTPSLVLPRFGVVAEKPDPALRVAVIHSKADSRTIYARDGWRCRFCESRVIDPGARIALAKRLASFRWGRTNLDRHAGALVHMASTDHVLPRAWGGTNDHNNLVTACWPCQFSRSEVRIDECGISDPRDRSPIVDDWDGLRRVIGLASRLTR